MPGSDLKSTVRWKARTLREDVMEGLVTLVVMGTGIAIAVGLSYASLHLVLSLLPDKTTEEEV